MTNANDLISSDGMSSPDTTGSANHSLTKREYFAIMAMQGILSNSANNSNNLMGVNATGDTGYINSPQAASEAVNYADALIEALNKSSK